jgi:hypothetical protein
MIAGVVLIVVGAAVAVVRALGAPGYWIPAAVGAGLLGAGAILRAIERRAL